MSAINENYRGDDAGSPRGVADEAAARQWCRARRIDDIECIIPDQAGVARGKLMPTEKFFGGNPMTLPASMFTADHHRRISGGGGGLHRGLTDSDLIFRADLFHARRRPLGERPDRAGDPRRLPQGRDAVRDRAAQRPEARRQSLSRARPEAGRRAGDGVLSGQAEHRSGLSARAAGRPLRPAGARAPGLFDHARSTSSRSSSTTSTASPRRRGWRSTR